MKIQDFIDTIEKWSPPSQAEDFDNVGLLVGDSSVDLKGVIISLDTTEEVLNEAIAKNCNLIISFHPIIFKGLKKITANSYVEKIVIKSILNKISIYSIHTSLDNHEKGVNYKISEKIGLEKSQILIPKKENKLLGMGRIGELKTPMEENKFLEFIKNRMKSGFLRHSKLLNKKIRKVAVLGGSGSFAIQDAIEQHAEVFLTADLKYHNFFEANDEIVLIDIGHYESEQFTKNLIHDYLRKKFPNFAIVLANTNTNPVKYF